MESTGFPIFVIAIAIISAYLLGENSGLQHAGLFRNGSCDDGYAGNGGVHFAMDTFGPITDNAGGIVEMSQQPKEVRDKTDRLDSVGNTTKALTESRRSVLSRTSFGC